MNRDSCGRILDPWALSRRDLLRQTSAGCGWLALAGMLANESQAAPQEAIGNALSARPPQFPAKAKRIIWLFMGGGPSHVDTFDPKESLVKYDRQEIPIALPGHLRDASKKILASPFKFQQHGKSGLPISDLFPNVAKHADDLCVVRSMHCNSIDHTGATLQTFTGMTNLPRPGIGCWLLYGLGTENLDLPGYVVMGPDQQSGSGTYSSRFLPACFQGTKVEWDPKHLTNGRTPVPNLVSAAKSTTEQQRVQLDLLNRINKMHAQQRAEPDPLDARTQSFELAFRMQASAPEAFNWQAETAATHKLYGLDNPTTRDFGHRCLLARRLSERGVRFVQVQCGKGDNLDWDQHGDLEKGHRKNSAAVDLPIAGLLEDLKQRGLLEDTLVFWGGEFGRTPTSQGTNGREHHPHGYSIWMAGGGVKPGYAHGATDEFGWYAVENKVHVHDLHATILHLMGIDHKQLTYRYSGRDFRLTDVHGEVVKEIIA
jgi:hypothetical protein